MTHSAFPLLQNMLHAGKISADVGAKLQTLAAACAVYDFKAAQKTQVELANADWNTTKDFMKGIRFLISLGLIKSGAAR
jgi:hypothetical protein